MGSALHQLCPRYGGTLTPTAPTAIRLSETFPFFKILLCPGLRQLARDVKNDVRTLNVISDVVTFAPPRKTPNGVQERLLCEVKGKK